MLAADVKSESESAFNDAIGGADSAGTNRLQFRAQGRFVATLRTRIDEHFGQRPRNGDPRLQRKAVLIAIWFVGSYLGFLFANADGLRWLMLVSYALAASAVGFNIFHDANHGSFSASKRVNLWVSRLTCAALGPSRYLWRHKHHALHHVFTNVYQWDDDIETRGHLRMSPRQPWQDKFRNQHRYFLLLYAFTTLEWFFSKNFIQYFTLRINPYMAIPQFSTRDKIEFWISAAVYFACFVALPFLLMPAWQAFTGLLVFHLLFGIALALIFQLAHGTEKVAFPQPTGHRPPTIDDEWAAHELRTTVNFGGGNRLLNWYSGGLNFQIEHHLFPHISHTHYPHMSAIVRKTAHEFGLPYHTHDSYFAAVASHYRMMRGLGVAPQAA